MRGVGFPWIHGEDFENIVTVSQRNCSNSRGNCKIQNFNLGTFLKKILDVFPFAYDLIFFFFIQTLSSQLVIQMVYVFHERVTKPKLYKLILLEPIRPIASPISENARLWVFSFFFLLSAFLCCKVILALLLPVGFYFFSIFS